LSSGSGDGTLTVSNGDVLTATYNDASPAATITATARVNFDAPVITDVHATSQGGSGTLVTWTTDRNSTSRVYFGATPAAEVRHVDSAGARLSHAVLLTGTTPGQTYDYDVESVSLSGSSARDDLGGSHYRFTAQNSADVLLVIDGVEFDRTVAGTNPLAAERYTHHLLTGPLPPPPPPRNPP